MATSFCRTKQKKRDPRGPLAGHLSQRIWGPWSDKALDAVRIYEYFNLLILYIEDWDLFREKAWI